MAEKRSAAIGFIFITLMLDVTGFGIIIPVLPKLIQQLSGEDISHAARIGGWLTMAYASAQFLFSPILGGLSDKYGRRPVLLFSLFGFALDYLFLSFAPTLLWLFVGRIIAGITGASITTATAYIADISTDKKPGSKFWDDRRCFWPGLYSRSGNWRIVGNVGTAGAFYGGCRVNVYQFYVWVFCTAGIFKQRKPQGI